MIRWLAYLITAVLAISVIRAVIGMIAQFFMNSTVGEQRSKPGKPAPAPASQSLKKDPVCGTFVAPSTAVVKEKGGETYYFCSAACRDKF